MRTPLASSLLVIVIHAAPAAAQVSLDGPATGIVDYAINMNYVMIDHLARANLRDALEQEQRRRPAPPPRPLVPPSPGGQPSANFVAPPSAAIAAAAKEFAAQFPPEQRAQIERQYPQVMQDYKGIEKRLGFPEDDLAGAMATFLLTSYIAFLQSGDLPVTHALAIAEQLRAAMPKVPAIAGASPQTRRKMYEGFVYSAVKMGGNARYYIKENRDPSKKPLLQQVARKNLETFLGVPAERVRITADGLALNL